MVLVFKSREITLLKLINSVKEVLIFCVISALSFVLMSEAVESIDAVTASFITYTISAVFYVGLNLKRHREIYHIFTSRKKDLLTINFSTLINTLSAFFVMQFVPPLTYVIVFFSSIPVFNALINRTSNQRMASGLGILVLSLAIAALTSNRPVTNIFLGISITLISSLFAAIYMKKTAELHKSTNITTSQILAVRFFW